MPTPAEDLAACAEALILADLRDWQQLADLQARFAALATADARLQDAVQALQMVIESLFTEVDETHLRTAGEELARRMEEMRAVIESAAGVGTVTVEAATVAEFVQRHQGELDEAAALLAAAGGGDRDAMDSFRRLVHTIKGDAGILGIADLGAVCHAIEDAARDAGALPVDALLKAIDWIEQRLAAQGDEVAIAELPPVQAVQAWLRAGAVAARERRESGTGVFEAASQAGSAADTPLNPIRSESARIRIDSGLAASAALPAEATPEMVGEFLGEVHDHQERIEGILLRLDGGAASAEELNALFRSFHTIKGLSGFLHLQREQILAHAAEDLLDRLRDGSRPVDQGVVDLLFAVLDALKQLSGALAGALGSGLLEAMPTLPGLIDALRRAAAGAPADGRFTRTCRPTSGSVAAPLGEILVRNGTVPADVVRAALAQQELLTPDRKLGEILLDAGMVSPPELGHALAVQSRPSVVEPEARPDTEACEPRSDVLRVQSGGTAVPATMRVDVDRVDMLNDAIGELVIAQNMLVCSPELRQLASRRVAGLLAQLDRVTRAIQDMAMRLRLVSIRPVFQRMIRLGRDAGRKLGKDIEVVVDDGGQELDKSVVDRLGDPLLHLVRNAVDHGIEPDVRTRLAAGKARSGQVTLRAYRSAGCFCVDVEDDGRGLNRERILAKAIERGLVRSHQQLGDDEIAHLIFLPGFSTAEQITEVSGRGVGMDVVKRMVEEMRGQVTIRSDAGRGTTVTIMLPLTLAIIDGMVVEAGGSQFIIPTLSVVSSARPQEDEYSSVCGRFRMLDFQGRQIPVIALRNLLGLPAVAGARTLVVVVEDRARRIGLAVDAVLGRQQVVLKTLGAALPAIPGVGGATINGDGRVCLVLDIPGLLQLTGGP